MEAVDINNGIKGMVPREKMSYGARKLRDFYELKPDAPIYQCEFGYYSLDRWKREGYINDKTNLSELFGFDEPGGFSLGGLGWCEAAFSPTFEVKILEDRGDHEVEQDFAGRHVLYFKGRRNGFMPDHPVKDMRTWEEKCKWRLDPATSERYAGFEQHMQSAREHAAKGEIITLNMVGGYMYLRSLMGPVDLLYKFYDDPELIHDCMKTWFELADALCEKYQQHVTIDEFFIGEDISYNKGLLISPALVREFLFPYYQQLMENIKARQLDRHRHLYFQLDTDGFADPCIVLYKELGMDYLSPFEVASGSDVVKTGREYPDLLMRGGIDKRILAQGREAIDRHLDSILPILKKRGGYIPVCDHGVPEEVSFEDYMHFRKRLKEY